MLGMVTAKRKHRQYVSDIIYTDKLLYIMVETTISFIHTVFTSTKIFKILILYMSNELIKGLACFTVIHIRN